MALSEDNNKDPVRFERFQALQRFVDENRIPEGLALDGSVYVATPYRILPSLFEEIAKQTGPLDGKRLLIVGTGDLRMHCMPPLLKG